MLPNEVISFAKTVISSEIESLEKMNDRLGSEFMKAISIAQNCTGRIIVIGMGKSGLIGKKIAATLASTGTPAFFIHPAEAFHGDLGMIQQNDVALLISNSGETEEIVRLIPFMKWHKIMLIVMTGNCKSTLANNADAILDIYVEKEACNNNLAPTNSTTASLVMGDAFSICLSKLKNFQAEDFAKFHPGGLLGRKLLTRVRDVMQTNKLPVCSSDTNFYEVVSTMTSGRLGLALIMEEDNLIGIITDGDLRRIINTHVEPKKLKANDFMSLSPKTVDMNELLTTAEEKMCSAKINSIVVTDDNQKVVGILQIYNNESTKMQ